MVWIRPLRLCSLSWVSLAVFALVGVNGFMVDNEANDIITPLPQANAPGMTPEERLQAWKDAYYGKQPPPAATVASFPPFQGEGWPIPPPGRTLEYQGYQVVINTDVFGLTVPSDEIWHMRTVILDVNFGSDTSTRSFQLEVTGGENSDIYGDYGDTVSVTASAGGNGTWSQNVVRGVTKINRFLFPLPTPFFLQPTWQIQALVNLKPSGDTINTAIFLYDAFKIMPLPNTPGGGTGTDANGATIPPWFAFGGPYFKLG